MRKNQSNKINWNKKDNLRFLVLERNVARKNERIFNVLRHVRMASSMIKNQTTKTNLKTTQISLFRWSNASDKNHYLLRDKILRNKFSYRISVVSMSLSWCISIFSIMWRSGSSSPWRMAKTASTTHLKCNFFNQFFLHNAANYNIISTFLREIISTDAVAW